MGAKGAQPPGAQGLRRDRAEPALEGLVHGRRRRLSDVYFPTNDNTNNETLQFVTDGRTFTDLQVEGTSEPGNAITVAATNIDANSRTTLQATTAAPDGSFEIAVPLSGGTSVLNIVATRPSGATAREVRTVVFDFVPGTLIFEASDPDGDDNGPGNYAYPTSADFKPGAFDIQQFQLFDSGDAGRHARHRLDPGQRDLALHHV
jgi:hypothetical protein